MYTLFFILGSKLCHLDAAFWRELCAQTVARGAKCHQLTAMFAQRADPEMSRDSERQ